MIWNKPNLLRLFSCWQLTYEDSKYFCIQLKFVGVFFMVFSYIFSKSRFPFQYANQISIQVISWIHKIIFFLIWQKPLTDWGRVTHICVAYLTTIASDNGLSPSRHQAIIWTNAWIFLIRPLGTNFSEILIEIHTFSFTKMHLRCRLRKGGHFVSASMC